MPEMVNDTWYPQPSHIAEANVTALMEAFGLPDYDSLCRLALEDPETYWRKINEVCGVVWSRPYDRMLDLSGGQEFPRWFVGGELNWVDTILSRGVDPAQAARPAVIAEKEAGDVTTTSYGELRQLVKSFAAGLTQLGITPGDRVGLLMEMGLEATVSLLALSYIGAITVPLFSGFEADAVCSRLSAAGARAIIGSGGFLRRGRKVDTGRVLAEAASRLPQVEYLILKGGTPPAAGSVQQRQWRDLLQPPPTDSAARRMDPNDPFLVIFTSGTTGKPKGIVHTHGGFPIKIVHDSMIHYDLREGDRYCWPADMGWVAGALFVSSVLMRGATMVCYDGAPDFPDWSRFSAIIERHQVTHLSVSPTLIRGLAAHASEALRGSRDTLRLMVTAGEAIDPEHFTWFWKNFGRGITPLINYTGGTEVTGGLLSSVVIKPIPPAGFNTVSPGIDVYVAAPDGTRVVDQVGELTIGGPFVGMTQSFWQDRERYLDSYWRAIPGVWVHGDLALQTANGDFFMRGRSDDTIKVAGKRLGPAEVEDVLLEMPAVSEAAAIGVEDKLKGQKLVVFVIPAPQAASVADLPLAAAEYIANRLGRAFRPGIVHVVAQLPKTRSSKVMRRLLRSVYCGQPTGDLSSLDNPSALEEIRQAAALEHVTT